MDYWFGIFRALRPKKRKDYIAMGILIPALTYIGWKVTNPDYPTTIVWNETQYPKEVVSGSYFFLTFDLQWNQTCDVLSRRYITGNDGIQYLASEDSKTVVKDERTQYVVRIPVDTNIPLGPATVRSDFSFSCDWFTTYIRPMNKIGRSRNILITSRTGMNKIPEKSSLSSYK